MTLLSEAPIVLIVGGWSPGPLVYLHSVLTSNDCLLVEPRSLPMPPFPSRSWCFHRKVLLSMIVCGFILWLASLQYDTVIWNLFAFLVAMVSIRFLAMVAVRTSIQVAAQSCLEAIRPYQENNVVLVGFSWGGAVRSNHICQGYCCCCLLHEV